MAEGGVQGVSSGAENLPDEITQRSFSGFAENCKVCEKERQKRG